MAITQTHPRIWICRPSQLSCGHPSVHDSLWEQTERQRAKLRLVSEESIISSEPQAWTAFKAQWSLSLSSANREDESFRAFSSVSARLLRRQETGGVKVMPHCWKGLLKASVRLFNPQPLWYPPCVSTTLHYALPVSACANMHLWQIAFCPCMCKHPSTTHL